MNDGVEVRREGEIEFSKPLARALFRDKRLSFAARGLFAFLWDLPADWLIRSTWLATRGPEGKDAIRSRLAELRAVWAMRIEPIRDPKDNGRLSGTRWILISPEKWARAAPLRESPESRIFRPSTLATCEESAAKVHQKHKGLHLEGSPPPTTPDANGGGLLSRWAEALALEIEIEAKQREIRNPAGLRRKIIARYHENGGPDAEVLAELERRHKAATLRATNEAAHKARLASRISENDKATVQRGDEFLARVLRNRATSPEL